MTYHDHHFHPLGYVSMVTGLELMDTTDFDDLAARVLAAGSDTGGAIIGQRLNDEGLREKALPDRDLLDTVSIERPILLYRYCGHIGVANTAALELAGVDGDTPDPEGGSIDRDQQGRPTGVLRETGLRLVSDALAPYSPVPSRDQILAAFGDLTDLGIGSVTGMVSAGEPMWCGVGNELETLLSMSGDLPIGINLFAIADTPELLKGAAEGIRRTEGRIRFGGWKDFADGSIGGHTAAMYQPFADRTLSLIHI